MPRSRSRVSSQVDGRPGHEGSCTRRQGASRHSKGGAAQPARRRFHGQEPARLRVTLRCPGVDRTRLGALLIRRFIDPAARLAFAADRDGVSVGGGRRRRVGGGFCGWLRSRARSRPRAVPSSCGAGRGRGRAAAGGLIGAMVGAAHLEERSRFYDDGVRRGGAAMVLLRRMQRPRRPASALPAASSLELRESAPRNFSL